MNGWVDVGASADLPDGARRLARVAGVEVALFRVTDQYYALEDRCPHNGASLVVGKVEGTTVTCRAHGLRFDLATGCMRGAAGLRARRFPVRMRNGRIEIDVSPAPTQLNP